MKQRFRAAFYLTLIFAAAAAVLRFWSLHAAVDDRGLPVMHLSVELLLGVCIVFVLAALIMSRMSPGRSGNYLVLGYTGGGTACGIAASVLILVGAAVEFTEELVSGPGIFTAIMLLVGFVGGFCCIGAVLFRRSTNRRYPIAELFPLVYLLLKLVLNFKAWSIDPIISDYCVMLFAMIFTLLAFYFAAGFVFDRGHARSTLFCAMTATVFCAAAIADGAASLKFSTVITFAGFLLWQLPVIWSVLAPSDPDPVPEEAEPSGQKQ